MGEKTFQLDIIELCYREADKTDGNRYQKRLDVLARLGITEQQFRRAHSYTKAMWVRHLLQRCRNADTVSEVVAAIRKEVEDGQPPTTNRGVNSAPDMTEWWGS